MTGHPAPEILVVEDERDVRELLVLHAGLTGGCVTGVGDGERAIRLIEEKNFNLLVLDWLLPGVSGLDICKHVRALKGARAGCPVLMVTAKAAPADIIEGLDAGADDYLVKPFDVGVYAARIRALLRRPCNHDHEGGGIVIDQEAHRAVCRGRALALTPYEFGLLKALLENRGRVLSRGTLLKLVQGGDVHVVERTIDTLVLGLRKKLGDAASFVETVRGIGYRIS